MRRTLLLLVVISVAVGSPEIQAQGTARDIKPPPGYQPGTGVDRNGIMSRRTPQVPTFTIPQGRGYYWGYSYTPGYSFYPGGTYYYGDYYCPYCGSPWCAGNCWWGHGPIYLPPVVGDAGALYGPRAARQFLGVDGGNRGGGGGNVNRGAVRPPAEREAPRVSNPTSRAQAWKFVEYGDRQFKKGQYRQALDRYEKASRQAGDVADIQFRRAFALLGLGKYAEATEAVKQGLKLKPDWPESGFVLEELYPDAVSKREIFRELTVHLDAHPRDAEAIFMLAVMQHFDGQEAAAEVKFRTVLELLGRAEHALAFLPPAPQPKPPAPPQGNADAQPVPPGNQPPPPPPARGNPRDGFGNLPPVAPDAGRPR